MKQDRIKCFDTLKFFAILLICTSHFIADYGQTFNVKMPAIYGLINGKFGVALFFVLSGYLTYTRQKNESIYIYIIKRYIYFFICAFIINNLFYLFNINDSQYTMNYGYVIGQTFLLGDGIFPTFWFVRDLFIGNILCFIFGKYQIKTERVVLALIFYFLNTPFICISIIGTYIQDFSCIFQKFSNNIKRIIYLCTMLLLIFILLCFDESQFMYVLYGMFSLVIASFVYSNKDSKLLNNRFLLYFGQKTMSIMLIHTLLIKVTINYKYSYLIYILLLLAISIILNKIINILYKNILFILSLSNGE